MKTLREYIDLIDRAEQGVAEATGLYGPFTVTINTGERPQSRTKTKKFRREDDAIRWAQDWLEDFPQYSFATAEVTDPAGNVVWTTDESLEEVSLDLAKRARDKAEHMVDMDYDDMRDKPYGHSEKQRIKFQRYIDKKEPRAKGDRDWSPPDQGVAEGNNDDSDMEIHQKNAERFRKNLGLPDRSSKKPNKETDMDQHRKNAERFGKNVKELEETEVDPVRRIEELFRDK